MSVILLEPPRPGNPNKLEEVVNAPLSACLFTGYIASVLHKQKIETEIINAYLYGWSIEQTILHLSKISFRLLCVHTMYLWEKTHDIFTMLSTIKSRNPSVHINLYGYYPTFAYKKILTDFPFIDSVTVGEPEFTSLDLAKQMETGCEMDLPGLAFWDKNGRIVFRPRPPIYNLDQLPYPERYDMELYQEKGIVTYVQGSRGCYGHCTFCYLNPFYGQTNQWRGRSVKNIFDEIFQLNIRYSQEDFYFSDANFFGPGKPGKERVVTLAELILAHDLNIRFGFECRANDIDEHSISKLVMAGLTNVFLGLESGDPTSLKRFKKHTTVEENKKAIQLLRSYGIEPTYGFIMFEPNSTMQSVRNNFEFLMEMGIMTTPAVTAHLLHHKQTLFQGTPDYQSIRDGAALGDTSFTDYEIFYNINDPKVGAFSEIISTLCKRVLSLLLDTYDCGTNASDTPTGSIFIDTLNTMLIKLFERTLSGFESGIIDYHSDALREYSQKLTREVETIFAGTMGRK